MSIIHGAGGDLEDIDNLLLTFISSSELTISSGSVTATQAVHTIDTESDAASDDLDTITAPNSMTTPTLLLIRAQNASRTVTVKHDTGNIKLNGGQDIDLDDADQTLLLFYDGSNWHDVSIINTTGQDTDVVSGTAGTDGNLAEWNADGDLVDSGNSTSDFASASHTHDTSDITSGTFDDARVAESNVTQHEGALTIVESQISDGPTLARVAEDETIVGDWTFQADVFIQTFNGVDFAAGVGGGDSDLLTVSDSYKLWWDGSEESFVFTENLSLAASSTETRALEIGSGRSGDGVSQIDLIGDATNTDYGFQMIRRGDGEDADSQLRHRGGGSLQFVAEDSGGTISLIEGGTSRLTVQSGGTVAISDGLSLTGDITVTGTVDGRDVASDGTKLDGIESGATADAAATEAEMNSASATDVYVTPGRQQHHPGTCKAWVIFTQDTTTTITDSYNVSGITDNGTGDFTINLDEPFANSDYVPIGTASRSSGSSAQGAVEFPRDFSRTTSAFRGLTTFVNSGSDRTEYDDHKTAVAVWGEQ